MARSAPGKGDGRPGPAKNAVAKRLDRRVVAEPDRRRRDDHGAPMNLDPRTERSKPSNDTTLAAVRSFDVIFLPHSSSRRGAVPSP
jgi:hypothetical protein